MSRSILQAAVVCSLLIGIAGCGGDDVALKRRSTEVFEKANDAFLRDDFQESKRLLLESAQLAARLDDVPRLAETSLLLGKVYTAGAAFDSASVFFEQSVALYRRAADKAGIRAAVGAHAAMHRVRSDDAAAFSILSEQLRLEEALGDIEGMRTLKWELIPVCRSLGDVSMERRLLSDLMKDYTEAALHAGIAAVFREYGESFLHQSNLQDAEEQFREALTHTQQAEDTLQSIEVYMRCAIVLEKAGKTEDSFAMFTEGLRRTDLVRGADGMREEMLVRVGNIYLRRKQYDEARRFLNAGLRAAIRSRNKLLEGYALLQLGHCRHEAGAEDAATYIQPGADLIVQTGVPWAVAYAQTTLGVIARTGGNLSAALTHARQAAASLDVSMVRRDDDVFVDCEETLRLLRGVSAYEMYLELLLQVGETEEAFRAVQRKQQRALFITLNALTIRRGNRQPDTTLAALAQVRRNCIGAERQLAASLARPAESFALPVAIQDVLAKERARMNELREVISATHPRLVPQTPLSFAEAQRRIPDGTVLVVYIPTGTSMPIVMVTRDAVRATLAPAGAGQLASLIQMYSETLKQGGAETNRAALAALLRRQRELSGRLYAAFVRPVELELPSISRLLVMLPEDLPFVPVHALQRDGRSGEVAIQKYAIRYLTDGDMLALGQPRNPTPSAVIGFGNQGRAQVDVEYEVRDVKAFFKEAKLLFRREASLEALRKERGDLLHASFELQYRPRHPQNSFFVLSEGSGYSSANYYRLGELGSLPAFATVLFSNPVESEFHLLLPRIFLINGSSDVVMNCFVAPRKARKMFNELFYTQLLAVGTTESAFRNAVLEMMKQGEFSTPHMWAAFTLW